MASFSDLAAARNREILQPTFADLISTMESLACITGELPVEIADLYDAGDAGYLVWRRADGGFRSASPTALSAVVNVGLFVLDSYTGYIVNNEKSVDPANISEVSAAVQGFLDAQIPIWRSDQEVDLPALHELQELQQRLYREGRHAMRRYGGLGTRPLSPGEQCVWKALEACLMNAGQLAHQCRCPDEMVRQHILSIRRKRGKDAVVTRGKVGYYRPDAPPDFSNTLVPVKHRRT